jgi:formate-dependent nitrite reductase membrane component NrfD
MQTSRQWMISHEWMVKGNHQTEWIEKRGILLWLAFYAGGLGGGLYIISLFFNNLWGMLAGWAIVALLKGSFHLLFLGKPTRFWRMVLHSQTSWLSRGLLFVLSFSTVGFIQLLLSHFLSGTAAEMVFKVLAGILALCVATYTGLVLNNVKGVPFWNLPILPLLFVTCGILGGFGLTVAIGQTVPAINIGAAETGSRWMLIINSALVGVYLLWAAGKNAAGKQSVLYQLKGGMAKLFWTGVVSLGVVIPLAIAFYSYFSGEATVALLVTGAVCEIIGGMLLRYCLLKSAIYNPIIVGKQVSFAG